ncbi:MAG TPA: NAD/NADP octopine/nopaline dehydrogenase family protein [Nitrososphaerales archaeon]|nr:NAD/NADP octopine/nopaline dehydrogenase family protein [Nitrososphaerales archaeon]
MTILGAGSGAYAAAVDLKLRGFDVQLCSTFEPDADSKIKPLQREGGIHYTGALGEGFQQVRATMDPSIIRDSELVMIITLANGYEHYALTCAHLFHDGQFIFLTPGYIGGSLRFLKLIGEQGDTAGGGNGNHSGRVRICETNNLAYISRQTGPTEVRIFRKSKFLQLGTLPSKYAGEAFDVVKDVYPFLVPVDSVLESGMLNPNIVLHPAGMVMNAGWIEASHGGFRYYSEGCTRAVARVMESFEEERVAVCNALGIKTMMFLDYYKKAGYTSEEATGIYEALRASEPNRELMAPSSLDHRYLTEDVGYGLVPMKAISEISGVPVPTMSSLVHLSSAMTGINFEVTGLNSEKMGLHGVTVQGLNQILRDGFS